MQAEVVGRGIVVYSAYDACDGRHLIWCVVRLLFLGGGEGRFGWVVMVAFVGFCGGIVKGLSPGKRTVTTCGPKAIGGGNRPGNGGLGGQSKSEPGVGKSTVLERPTQTQKAKIDPGKRYKVIIFNEVNQTR